MLTNAERCKLYYERHKAERMAYQAAYYRAHKEAVRQCARAHYWADPKKARAERMEYRWRNIDRIREHDRRRARTDKHRRYATEYYWKNRLRIRIEMIHKRREQLAAAKAMLGGKCQLCGYAQYPDILQCDHLLPPTRKGRTRATEDRNIAALKTPEKFQLLCPSCHAIKTALWKRTYPRTYWSLKSQKYREKTIHLLGGHCRACSYSECFLALQFDHIVPIHKSSGRSGARSMLDARKHPEQFQILCANCHAMKTLREARERAARKAAEGVA